MKPVASTSPSVYWDCHGLALLFRTSAGPAMPFQFMYLPIGLFYGRFAHRLLTHLLLAACLISGVFLALAIAGGAGFISHSLPLACTMALYLAVVFTLCHVFSDFSSSRLLPRSMRYGSRNVGRQCVVLFIGLILGYWVHGRIFPDLIQLCAQSSASQIPISLSLVPLLCAVLYACVFLVPMCQHDADRIDSDKPDGSLNTDPPVLQKAEIPQHQPVRPAPSTAVSFRVDGRGVTIPIKDISHISTEDHYCRVYFQHGQGQKDLLVREALKELAGRLRSDDFIRIHRSHLVNKRYVNAYKRKGRKHWLLLGSGNAPLSISRRRQAQVKEALADAPQG
jgi:hypothetical protein